jgi:hypothetical protein
MKNKNLVLKTCFTGLFLSMSGLAAANTTVDLFSNTTSSGNTTYSGHAAIAGGTLSVAAGSQINGDLAAQASLVIGAGAIAQNVYAGAAVSTGSDSTVKAIYGGAAADIANNAIADTIIAGAAITVGAGGKAQNFYAGAAITLGAGTTQLAIGDSQVYAGAARTGTLIALTKVGETAAKAAERVSYLASAGSNDDHIAALTKGVNSFDMPTALTDIDNAYTALATLTKTEDVVGGQQYTLGTSVANVKLAPGVYQGGAVNAPANAVIKLDSGSQSNQVWIFNLTDAVTLGAGTQINTDNAGDNATIIWNVGGALNLGAGAKFAGIAIVKGSVTGATADLTCGNLYAKGAVSIGSIGSVDGFDPEVCDQSAERISSLSINEPDIDTNKISYTLNASDPH